MTEQEWVACTDPDSLINFVEKRRGMVRKKAGRRKLWLFACACCRSVWDLILDEPYRRGVEATESFADGLLGKEEHRVAREAASVAAKARWTTGWEVCHLEPTHQTTILWRAARAAELAADKQPGIATVAARIVVKDVSPRGPEEEKQFQVALAHDLIGNPFRPAALERAWLTWNDGAVKELARATYEHRVLPSGMLDTARLSVLADALEDAGCADEAILTHLRGPGLHVRGCWVIDRILGKE